MPLRPASSTLVLIDARHPGQLVSAPNRAVFGPIAHVLGWTLDRRLAAGCPPESSRLLAVRALRLVSAKSLTELARNWVDVLDRVDHAPIPGDPSVPLCRDRVIAARPEIERLLCALAAPLPKPARGVATASWLLRDGSGPLYNHRCSEDLRDALRAAISQLDPLLPLEATPDRNHSGIHR